MRYLCGLARGEVKTEEVIVTPRSHHKHILPLQYEQQ